MASYADELLFLNEDSIVIDTGMSGREAAQAKLMQFLIEPGYIAEVKPDGSVSFGDYKFSETYEDIAKGRKNASVFVRGPAYKGTPLYEVLKCDDIEKARSAADKVARIIEASFDADLTLPPQGPLGTIMGDDGTVLFLPHTILNRALNSRSGAILSRYEGCWKNTALAPKDSLRFTAAAYAYTVLAGEAPFPAENSQIRVEDYYDRNFKRLKWFCRLEKDGAAVDADKVFKAVEQDLTCTAPEMETASQKKRNRNRKRTAVESVCLPEIPAFDSRNISDVSGVGAYQAQQKKLKRVRFLRRNGSVLNVCVIVAMILAIIGGSYIKDILARPTTLGMEPEQVVRTFYKGFDTLDTILFDSTRTNGAGDSLGNIIATYFVTVKMRESYEGITTYTPSKWLNLKNPYNANLYGVSHLTLEEDESYATDTLRVFRIHYYIIHNDSEGLLISEVNDELAVIWRKDRWLVASMESEDFEYKEDTEKFFNDLKALVPPNSEYDQEAVINALAPDYPWLPTLEETKEGLQQMIDKAEAEKI